MMDETANQLSHLRDAVDRQNQLQNEANNLMRTLIETLQKTTQEIADSRNQVIKLISGER